MKNVYMIEWREFVVGGVCGLIEFLVVEEYIIELISIISKIFVGE